MRLIPEIVRRGIVNKVILAYRRLGFWSFARVAVIYFLQRCRMGPQGKPAIIIIMRLNRLRDKKCIPTTTAINVEVTNICNCNCLFCAYSKMTRNKGIMELELFKNVIEQAVELKIGTFGLTPIVGEPLLDPSFLEKCDYLNNAQKVKNFYFFTNGILLNKVMFQKLQKYFKKLRICVSLYGTTRDQFKELTGTDKFDTVMNNFESISSCNIDSGDPIEISVGYRCGDINPEIWNFMEEIRAKGGIKEQFSLRSFDTWGGMVDANVLKQHNFELIPAPFQLGECSLPYYRWIVTWDGLVNACACRDANATLVIGDLKTESLKDILEGNTRKILLRNMALGKFPPICRGCTHYRSVYLYYGVYKNRQLRSKSGQLITERY